MQLIYQFDRRTMDMDERTTTDGVPDNPLSEPNSDYRLPLNLDLGVTCPASNS